MATINETTSPVWPVTGIAIGVLFLFGLRYWPIVFLAAFYINFSNAVSVTAALFIGAGNTIEAVIGAIILMFFSQKKYLVETHIRTIAIVVASLIGASISAMVGTLTLVLSGASPGEMFDSIWLTWWTGDALGGIMILPLILSFTNNSYSCPETRETPSSLQTLAMIVSGLFLCWLLFVRAEGSLYLFFIFPYMLWCVAQAGERGAAVSAICISAFGICSVKFGYGVFHYGTTNANLINLQLFLGSVGVSSLLLTDLKRVSSLKQPALILFFSWFFAGLLFLGFSYKNYRDSDNQLNMLANGVEPLLESQMNNYFAALQSGSSLFTASEKVTVSEWRLFLEHNKFTESLTALTGLGVIFRVPKDEVEAFIEKNELRKNQDFNYHTLPDISLEEQAQNSLRPDAYMVTFIEPYDFNKKKAGLDMASEDQRRMAADMARDTGAPSITGRVKLIDDPKNQPAMIAYFPFYSKGDVPISVMERRERLVGWIYSPIMTNDFFKSIFSQGNLKEISFQVSEEFKDELVVITSSPDYHKLPNRNEIVKKIRFGNHDFIFQFKGTAAFYANQDSFSSWVGAIAAIISILLGTLIVSLQTMKKRALLYANQKTEDLRASEELWKFALEGAGDTVWDWEIETGKVTFSKQLNNLLGYAANELHGDMRDWEQRVHVDDIEKARLKLRALFNSGENFLTECRLLCKNGNYKWVLIRGMIVKRDREDKPSRMVGTIADISNQKEIEYELERQRSKLHSIFEGSSDALMLLTAEGGFFDCNSRTLKLFGLNSKDEFTSLHPSDLSPEFQEDGTDSLTKANEHIQKAFAEGVNHFEWTHCRKNGKSFPAEVLLTAFSYDGKTILQACVRDISERKQAEEILVSQREKLVASAKMSSLGEMAGGIAHEINNPLTIIIGKTALLKRRLENDGTPFTTNAIADELNSIQNTAKRIGSIIKGLRSFSRNAENDLMEKIQVKNLIDETLEFAKERFKFHDIELRVKADSADQICITGRAAQLLQVLVNLLNNAYDAVENLSEKWVELKVERSDDYCRISVTDSGDGIDPDLIDKIMMPFFTTKEVGKGTGLGLSISRGIIEDHHGKLYYDTKNAHTSFVIELPIN